MAASQPRLLNEEIDFVEKIASLVSKSSPSCNISYPCNIGLEVLF